MNFLTGMAFWQILILFLIIIIAIFGLTLFIIFLIYKFKLSVKTKFIQINSLKKENEKIKNLEYTEKKEIVYIEKKEFIQILNRIKDSMKKIENISKIKKLEEQMKFAEETLLTYNLSIEKQFFNIIKLEEDRKQFSALLKIYYYKALSVIKKAFKTNNFEKKVGTDFEEYVERKFAIISKEMKDIENDYLIPFKTIKINKFKDFIQNQTDEQKKIIIKIFKNAQKEFTKAKEKIFKEDMSLDDFIWSLVDIKKGD